MVRGGIGFGDIIYDIAINSVDSKEFKVGNLYGPAVVEATDLEKIGKGSRLFCSKNFPIDCLGSLPKNLLCFAPESNCYELLWGALGSQKVKAVRDVFKASWSAYQMALYYDDEVREHYKQARLEWKLGIQG